MDSMLKISEHLHKSSLEATESVEQLLQAVMKVKVACSVFADVCSNNYFLESLKSTKCISPIPQVIGEQAKATSQLVSVSTYLSENGTFWCRLLEDFTYNEKLLNDISNKLWWHVKDLTVEVLHRVPLNYPIFHFSPTYNMYVRGIVINTKEKKYSVRYLDFGCALDVSAETQFFLLPKEFQNQQIYQYQSLCCTLFNEDIKIPCEGRRIFSDLTNNHVFKIEIKGSATQQIPDSPYNQKKNHVELRTIPGNKLINHEVMKKVIEHGKEVQKKSPEDLLPKNVKNDDQHQTPLALNSSIAPVVLINCISSESEKTEESKPQMKFDRICSVSKSSLFDGSIQKFNSLSNLNEKKVTNSKSVSLDLLPGFSNETDFEATDKSSINSEEKLEYFVKTDQTNLSSPDKLKQRSHLSKLPPLQNLLYNSTTPRHDSWQEIELMNISKLLKSQATIKFFICAVSKKRVFSSLKTKKLELKKDIFRQVPKNTSVYVILREFTAQDQPVKDFYIGIAKVDVNQNYNLSQNSPTEKFNVSYLSLSCIPMIDQRHRNMNCYSNISLMEAKAIIKHYQLCLKKRTTIPFTKDIFPWCENVSQETLQYEERSEQPLDKKSSDIIYLPKEDFQEHNSGQNTDVVIENKLSILKMDSKNIEFNVSMQNNGLPIAPESNIVSLHSTIGRGDNDKINNHSSGEFSPRAILQRPPTIGYYDSTGMWFPESHSGKKN